MLISKKPASDEKLTFLKMGAKPASKKAKKPTVDVENAADAKKPGDAKEDAADQKKGKTKSNPFAAAAALALAKKG